MTKELIKELEKIIISQSQPNDDFYQFDQGKKQVANFAMEIINELQAENKRIKLEIAEIRKIIYHDDYAHLDTNDMILLLNNKLAVLEKNG